METVSCTINGVRVEVPKGTRIIEAAEQAGIGIAHYCYHPGLSAPAMCRMCLVEVEGAPKLAPACVTTVGPDQVIHTESEKARYARQGTLEFYLANHPLDCPVCDKSGECRLQDFVHSEGRKHGRSIEPKRVLGQDNFGGDILYDGDRCIMCTRCVRFTREISQSDALAVVQRGSRSVIDTFFDHGVEGDPFAGNVVDICPVGALLSKDFLHKARVWDLDHTPSICPNCSQGCNIRIDTRDNLVARLKPRPNSDVNSWWMCDYGRQNYEWINAPDRLDQPVVRESADEMAPTRWKDLAVDLVARLQALTGTGVVLVGSPSLSNEDNGLAMRLAKAVGETEAVYRSRQVEDEVVCAGFPKLARRRDLAANVRGLEVLGYRRVGDANGTGGLPETDGKVVVVLGDALDDAPDFGKDAALMIVLAHRASRAWQHAYALLPVTTFAECDGTFTNHEGRVQRFWPALDAPAGARPAWQVAGVLLAGLAAAQAPADAGRAFLTLAELSAAFDGLSYEVLGTRGAMLQEPALLDVAGGD